MWPWGTPFNKTMIKTKHYCFEVFISICFCVNKCGQLIMLGSVGQAEAQAMVWIYGLAKSLHGLGKTRDQLRITCPSCACSRATRRSLMTESKMFLGSLLWVKITYVIMDYNFFMAVVSHPSSKISLSHLRLSWKPHFSLPSYGKYEKTRSGNTRQNHYKKLKFWIVFGIFRG